MVTAYTNYDGKIILQGNDTDVSWVTIVKMNDDTFVITTMLENDITGELHNSVKTLNRKQFMEEFTAQYNSPMQYLSASDYSDFIRA